MDAAEYVAERLQPQIAWYENRSAQNKLCFRLLSGATVIASASVPFAIAAAAPEWVPALLGAVTAIVVGLLTLLKCQESWLSYRSTTEMLRKELYYFETRTGPYLDVPDPELTSSLVERVESTISGEHQVWLQRQSQPGAAESPQG